MRDRDEIADLLKNTYRTYSTEETKPQMNTSYICNMLIIELLCDIRDMLENEIDAQQVNRKHIPVKNRKRPLH